MTKKELKNEIDSLMEEKYGECEWTQFDTDMFDYYYAIYGKDVTFNADNDSLVFRKGGYATEVSVGSWNVVFINNEKEGRLIQ